MTANKSESSRSAGYLVHEEQNKICVFLEHRHSAYMSVSLELLGKARQLADQSGAHVSALLIGAQIAHLAEEAIAFGADEVQLIDDERLGSFHLEAYTDSAAQAILQARPSIFLLGATHDGRDLAGRMAVRLQTGLNADCTDLLIDKGSGQLISEVTGFGGGIIALLDCPERRPQMSTVRPGVFPLPAADSSRTGKVVHLTIDLHETIFRTQLMEQEQHEGLDISQAEILICGGRGVGGDFDSLQALASLLKGEVGATRPPVDDGYVERERQVGQTGVVCRPKIAICLGISGAFHFVVGIEKADIVVAVNSDPAAPIFEYADYNIIADVHEFLPVFMHALEQQGVKAHA